MLMSKGQGIEWYISDVMAFCISIAVEYTTRELLSYLYYCAVEVDSNSIYIEVDRIAKWMQIRSVLALHILTQVQIAIILIYI